MGEYVCKSCMELSTNKLKQCFSNFDPEMNGLAGGTGEGGKTEFTVLFTGSGAQPIQIFQ